MIRPDDRDADALRPVAIERRYTKFAEGSVLITVGDTQVICTATVEGHVPAFLRESGTGWVTAEYAMLPRSASGRISRDSARRGRAVEISRFIGRSLRCAVDLSALGERCVTLDCDVLQADGGTRTAAITGAYVALHDALSLLVQEGKLRRLPLLGHCAATSVGMVEGEPCLDLCYEEDVAADVDMNVVMRSDDAYIEVSGTAEGDTFSRHEMNAMLDLAETGIRQLFDYQKEAMGL